MCAEERGLGFADSGPRSQLDFADSNVVSNANSYTSGYRSGDLIADKYRLVRPIGRGGMGVVWEAHSQVLDIRVAVKLIQQFTASSEMHQRLLLEARAAARLIDPGVIRVFDCGQTSRGDPYIVMELLEGEDLATRVEKRGRLQPIEALRTLLPIVRALGAVHAANIVHRDVKPENVFFTKSLTGEEQPKLFDFGIAKVDVSWEKRLTQAGSTVGSPSYMSPEQAQGEEIDRRSDLWGICVVLYEVITGRLPFDGNSYKAIIHAILSADIAPFSKFDINEPELWYILEKGLERDREMRWQSSDELADALGAWLLDRGVMHDVTGVSLHATRTNRRARQIRTLETERPPNQSGKQLQNSRAEFKNTVNRTSVAGIWLRSSRLRRYLLIMSLIAASGAMIAWRIKRVTRTVANSSPSATARAAMSQPETKTQAVPALVSASPVQSPPVQSTGAGPLSPVPAISRSISKAPAAAVRAPKAKSNVVAPKNEPFKSPFE